MSITQRLDGKAIIQDSLEIIGEAAGYVPDEVQGQYAEMPWAQMKGMRNILIHEYFGVDTEVIWKTVRHDLPFLHERMKEML